MAKALRRFGAATRIRYRRMKPMIRRGAGAAARAAASEKHTLAALATAAVLGFAQREGWDLPHVKALGRAGTYGLALWGIGRFTRSRMAEHAATGALSIAIFQLTSEKAGLLSGLDDEPPYVEGEIPYDEEEEAV